MHLPRSPPKCDSVVTAILHCCRKHLPPSIRLGLFFYRRLTFNSNQLLWYCDRKTKKVRDSGPDPSTKQNLRHPVPAPSAATPIKTQLTKGVFQKSHLSTCLALPARSFRDPSVAVRAVVVSRFHGEVAHLISGSRSAGTGYC